MTNLKQAAELAHLETIDIQGYRSCENTKFNPNRDLSVLIGINGAGKTNILQGIRLLALRQQRRGRQLADEFSHSPEAQITAWFSVKQQKIGLRIKFLLQENPKRGDNQLYTQETWNLQSFTNSKAWIELPPLEILMESGALKNFVGARQIALFESSTLGAKRIREWFETSETITKDPSLLGAIESINAFRSCISYYSASQFTDPTRCPSSFEVDEEGRLSENFSISTNTHQKFLHGLYRLKKENPDLYENYCDFVSRRQLGLVSRITWKEIILSSNTAEVKSGGSIKKIKKTKTLVIPRVQVGTSHITFNQLSEGTFKTLALIFYTFTDSSRLLMVEEPEVCIHHGLLSKVVATLKAQSAHKQTLVSTHSDQLLDQLEPENVFVVQMGNAGTQVSNLEKWLDKSEKRALHDYLAESGTLGEYWKSGGLTR